MGSKDYLLLLRPINVGMITAMTIAGMWFGNPTFSFPSTLINYLFGIVVAIAYSGIAMIHNDIIDIEIDRINAPHRALPSGRVSKKAALLYMAILFVIGTSVGVWLRIESVLIMFITLVLSLLYNWRLKKTGFIGNLIVGYTATSAFIYGDAVSAGFSHFWPPSNWNASVYLFLISALLNTSREVTKGIMDMEGDRKYGVKTIAVKYGPKFASRFVIVLNCLALLLAIIPVVEGVFGPVFIIAAASFLGLMLLNGVPLLKKPNYETAKKFKDYLHPIMLLALVLVVIDIILADILHVYETLGT
ncbi:MAG: hypothetical protein D6732_15600 [Methanobacteriota archaeon]|nr:MAG: hypothetical protein D6732_15600 [Euryarchaeota archaeon]